MNRVQELIGLFGDPDDPANPVGRSALLAADERGELSAAGEDLLDRFGFGAEFVPTELGGRLDRLDSLVRVAREVFRRDVGLGLGYGVTSFMAAVNIWAGGSPQQRKHLAGLLLDGAKVSVAYHELAHGNDFLRNEFTARRIPGGYVLDGTKQVINNADRAAAWVLFARTDPAPGARSHSVLLTGPEDCGEGLAFLPRYRTAGVRGCHLTGLDFRDCAIPAGALVGEEGHGAELALRSFQITRSALPGMAVGTVDTCLRTVLRFALGRRLYRGRVLDLPHAATTLTGAFTDLLLCDSLALAAARAVHLLPGQSSVTGAAVKYLVPRLLGRTAGDLSVILGARFYVREGEHAIFGKHLRDLPVLSLGHAGSTACLATLIPQLPRLARNPGPPAPNDLFTPGGTLTPGIPYEALTLAADGDALGGVLDAVPEVPDACTAALLRQLAEELAVVRAEALALPPAERTPLAGPASFRLADRYAQLLAAAAAAGVWRAASDGFLADPAWLAAALHRTAARLGLRPAPPPTGLTARVRAELLRRYDEHRSFDLYDLSLDG
ncbi:acyl-CoA dehydrogenase [Streptomyces sp. S.PB5]|uniref:acyl-CoA dehydrogenase n=1 Tax=Streptomyces sp. S.PB5 TaxID=3020844 RepID=UPI0025AEE6E0|nr:acyl-CoA dehydrogenase [Streptomyces sp. S.PB5]MDN3022225.1 acyl-CoA dehydrogenase [Streptomyces sp. S.PB5]